MDHEITLYGKYVRRAVYSPRKPSPTWIWMGLWIIGYDGENRRRPAGVSRRSKMGLAKPKAVGGQKRRRSKRSKSCSVPQIHSTQMNCSIDPFSFFVLLSIPIGGLRVRNDSGVSPQHCHSYPISTPIGLLCFFYMRHSLTPCFIPPRPDRNGHLEHVSLITRLCYQNQRLS